MVNSAMDTPNQVPGDDEVFLDHIGWFVPDLDAAAVQFERLGFSLTPHSVHGDRDPQTGEQRLVGSANRLAMLPIGYLEILGAVDGADTPVSRHIKACLDNYTGVHLAAFTVPDAEREAARQRDAGFEIMATTNLRRQIEAEDGSSVEVAFTVIRALLGSVPEGRLQTLTHHTPEHMWQRRYVENRNGVRALLGVTFATDDMGATEDRLSRYTGRAARRTEARSTIELDRGRLDILTADEARATFGDAQVPSPLPAIVALHFSGDVDICAAHCREAGVAFTQGEMGEIRIPAQEAMGVTLVMAPDTSC